MNETVVAKTDCFIIITVPGRKEPRELERAALPGAVRPAAQLQAEARREAQRREGRLQPLQVHVPGQEEGVTATRLPDKPSCTTLRINTMEYDAQERLSGCRMGW